MNQRVKVFIWFFGIFFILNGLVFAKSKNEETHVYKLGEIIVTAEKEGVESVGTVREITASDIERGGARTLDEALRLLPGLDIRTGTDGVPRVDMRGFRSRHVVLLLNGTPFNSTFDGQFDPSLISVENIAKIKVSYGNHSVLYGDGGLGGVINVVTKKGTQGFQGTASVEAREKEAYLGTFTLSGLEKNTDYFLSGSLFTSDGYLLSDDFGATSEEDGYVRENSDEKRNNFFANIGYTPNNDMLIGVTFSYLGGEFGKPPCTINDNKDIFANTPKYERTDDFKGYSGQVSIQYDVAGPMEIKTWAFFNQLEEENNLYDDSNYNTMDDPAIKTFHEEATSTTSGLAFQTKYDLKNAGTLSMSLNMRKEEWESAGKIRDVEIKKKEYEFRNFDENQELNIYSAALEYEFMLFKDVGMVMGYSHHWLDKEDGEDDQGSFLIGAYYDMTKETQFHASFAKKIRFPSIRQLYEAGDGNPDLTTEESYNYELGLTQRFSGNSSISLTGFRIDVEDYIEKVPPEEIFQNFEEYCFQGIEVAAETHFSPNFMLRAGYTFLDTEDKSPNTEKEELQYRPKDKLTLEARYDFGFGLSINADMMYVANQYYYSKKSPLIKAELDDYTLVNLKLDQNIIKDSANLYFGIDNLFDENYEESYGFPRAGITFYGGLKLMF